MRALRRPRVRGKMAAPSQYSLQLAMMVGFLIGDGVIRNAHAHQVFTAPLLVHLNEGIATATGEGEDGRAVPILAAIGDDGGLLDWRRGHTQCPRTPSLHCATAGTFE